MILNPPPEGASWPGLVGQAAHQNNPNSPFGFFALDGFADFSVDGFRIINVPENITEIILASDGYPVAPGQNAAVVLSSLEMAESNLADILHKDPMCFTLNKCTKGKGSQHSFDDRAYLRLAL